MVRDELSDPRSVVNTPFLDGLIFFPSRYNLGKPCIFLSFLVFIVFGKKLFSYFYFFITKMYFLLFFNFIKE